MLPETEFWDPSVSLPCGLRNVVELFERELAQHVRLSSVHSEFMGMVDDHLESFCNLPPSTPDVMGSDSSSTGSRRPTS